MSEQERFESELRGWLREAAPRRAPDYLVPLAMGDLHGTRQRRATVISYPVLWFAVTAAGLLATAVVVALALGLPKEPTPVGSVPPIASTSSSQASTSMTPTSTPLALPSFTIGEPADVNATWTTLSWRKLDAADPLASIRRVVPWSGGYVAIGRYDAVRGGTPIWTSMDGAHFRPMSFIGSAIVLDVRELKGTLMALVADPDTAECPDVASCVGNLGAVRMLISVDRINWREGSMPNLASKGPINGEPLTATGPAGLLVATSQGPLVAARSSDGVAWSLESAAFPQGFELAGVWGRPDGYAAVGTITSGASDDPDFTATALWSDDGRTWSIRSQHAVLPDFALAASEQGPLSSFVSLVAGRDGAIAVSHEGGTPGVRAWWHSVDGRSWQKIADFPPLGPALRDDGSSFGVPDGKLASDGSRLVAIGLDDKPAAWTSFDASTWTQLTLDGPPSQGGDLLVLPDGVLLFDGQTTWLGAATAR